MSVKDLITQYVTNNTVMQLATIAHGFPQLCSVHYAVDEDLNFYWFSARSSNHSLAIHLLENAATGIVHSIEKRQCVHSQGEARIATGDEAMKAHDCYSKRFGDNSENINHTLSDDPNRPAYYIYKPTLMVLFDSVNFPDNPRQELKLR